MLRNITILVLLVAAVVGWVFAVIGFVRQGTDGNEIVRLRTQIDRFGQENRDFDELNKRFEAITGEGDGLKREREGIIRGLQATVGGAGENVRAAIEGIRECRELAQQIEN